MINQNIGSFIAAHRKEKGWTQEELAEKLSVSNRSISRWENGNTLPDYTLMFELAEVLDVSVTELLTGQCRNASNHPADDIRLILELEHRENKLQRRQVNLRFAFGFACLILAVLDGPWSIFARLPTYSQSILFWLCIVFGCFFAASGFYANRSQRCISQKEIDILIAAESDLQMKTAEEMLRFTKKNQHRHKEQHKRAFEHIASTLSGHEYVGYAFIADDCTMDSSPGPWHISAALTNDQLLICGETMHGRLLPSFPVYRYPLDSLKSIQETQHQVLLQFADHKITLRGSDLQAAAEQLRPR